MSEKTKISWCDSTINFWSGCTKVSAGCANCYAETLSKRKLGNIGQWGKGAPRRLHESAFKLALKLNKKPWICESCGQQSATENDHLHIMTPNAESKNCHYRRRIFSLSLGDWLDDEVPIEWLARMLDTIRQCDRVIWILCTKRPQNWQDRLCAAMEFADRYWTNGPRPLLGEWIGSWIEGVAPHRGLSKIPQNIILLTSVENQEQADKRIGELLKIPAACHGLSLEPLLGPVNLPETPMEPGMDRMWPKKDRIKWLIIGGESGNSARTCNINWIRNIFKQGHAAGIPVFVKQLGANRESVGITTTGDFIADKKGSDPAEWPADLRVRQFPKL